MSATYAAGDEVVLAMNEKSVPAVVVTDDGGESVVVRFDHPILEGRQTTAVPVLREFLSPAG